MSELKKTCGNCEQHQDTLEPTFVWCQLKKCKVWKLSLACYSWSQYYEPF